MGEKHLIKIVTLKIWRVSTKIIQQSEQQVLNKFSTRKGDIFLAIPRKIDTGLQVLFAALSVFQQLQMFRYKSDAM